MRRTLIRMAVAMIVIPIAAWGLGRIAEKVEGDRGPDSKLAKGLRLGSGALRRA